jgi:hypothetical protein
LPKSTSFSRFWELEAMMRNHCKLQVDQYDICEAYLPIFNATTTVLPEIIEPTEASFSNLFTVRKGPFKGHNIDLFLRLLNSKQR